MEKGIWCVFSDEMPGDGMETILSIRSVLAEAYNQYYNEDEAQPGEEGSSSEGAWICPECGQENEGKFCSSCGHKKD